MNMVDQAAAAQEVRSMQHDGRVDMSTTLVLRLVHHVSIDVTPIHSCHQLQVTEICQACKV